MDPSNKLRLLIQTVHDLHQRCNSKDKYHIRKDFKDLITTANSLATAIEQDDPPLEVTLTNDCQNSPQRIAGGNQQQSDKEVSTLSEIRQLLTELPHNVAIHLGGNPELFSSLETTSQKPTYATITAKPALLVTHNDSTDTNKTIQDIRKELSFKDRTFGPQRIKALSSNKMRIEFANHLQREQIREQLKKSPHLTAEDVRLHKPMLIIKGIPRDIPIDQLCTIIARQNQNLNCSPNEIQFKFTKHNRKIDLYNAVIQVTPGIFKAALHATRLNIDHCRIHVSEYVGLVQCYKCYKFGHFQNACDSKKLVCSHCSGINHTRSQCPNLTKPPKCYNCTKYAKTSLPGSQTEIKAPHTATSLICPQIKFMMARLKKGTAYD